jgi:protein TonB
VKTLHLLAFILLAFNYSKGQANDTGKIYSTVEQNPEYPGGDAALMKFLTKNIQYPILASNDDFCGKILIRFVIDTDGSVIKPQIIRSCGPTFDKELLRVIKFLPRFKPGYQNGKAVKVYFNLPIVFEPNK